MPTANDRTAARRLRIRDLLQAQRVDSQQELVHALARRGHEVTQTTISRDLKAMGAQKNSDGRYVLTAGGEAPERALVERLRQFAVGISSSANIVVIHTPPGTAHSIGAALDSSRPHIRGVLGCVAGDDTLLVVTRSADGGAALARRLRRLMED